MYYKLLKKGYTYHIIEDKDHINLTWFNPKGEQVIDIWLQYNIEELQVTYLLEPEKSFTRDYYGSYLDGFSYLRKLSKTLIKC